MEITELLNQKALVLDGAMSTPLEHAGVKTNNDLWTATALIEDPQKVYQVHMDYFKAGADMVITDTYQANLEAFKKHGLTDTQGRSLIRKAVKLAKSARDAFEEETGKHNYVAGTIGPYGAYLADGSEYRGDYELTKEEYRNFHKPRLEELVNAGVDVLAVETQPKLEEVQVLLDMIKEDYPTYPVYVSFSLQDAYTISEGTPLAKAIHALEENDQIFAIGFNCVPLDITEQAVKNMREITDKPIIIYPNSGATYDPTTKTWSDPKEGPTFKELIPSWYEAGANIIGGCCTTMPSDIENVTEYLETINN